MSFTEKQLNLIDLKNELLEQGILIEGQITFRGIVYVELANLKGKGSKRSFSMKQVDFIKSKNGVYNMNMDRWLLPLPQ